MLFGAQRISNAPLAKQTSNALHLESVDRVDAAATTWTVREESLQESPHVRSSGGVEESMVVHDRHTAFLGPGGVVTACRVPVARFLLT